MAVSAPLLATKLYVPPARPDAVARPALLARLNDGIQRRLTLVSAPAGFGKTTLISTWAAGLAQHDPAPGIAWLSLDEADADPARFLTYLIGALQTTAPALGGELLPLLQTPQPPIATLLTALLNDIAGRAGRIILVLDDYHRVDATAVDDAVAFLIEHLPPNTHLVITTREDPDLPLARLRARGQLTEIRARDLRFSAAEAARFLNDGMGLGLSPADVAALENRTEGWIAGLQLAGLSLQGQQDIPAFIRSFAGDHRYIVDYLMEEVLARLPTDEHQFLLQTAILDRFSAPLCDAVTGLDDSRAHLEALERGNFFLVPLDDKRQWYRYHHLFADVLTAHLRAEQPDQEALLHRRASAWYAAHDLPFDAIRHALLGGDDARAADLIELAVPVLRRSRQESTLLTWFQALPETIFHARPVLSAQCAGTLLQSGQTAGVEARLHDAERWLEPGRPPFGADDGPVVLSQDDFQVLPGMVAMYRAALSVARGQLAETMYYAQQVPALVPDDAHLLRGAAAGLMALVCWPLGELEQARQWYSECMDRLEAIGYVSDAIGCAIALADILLTQGKLAEAEAISRRGLALAAQHVPALRGVADMHIALGELAYQRGDLTDAWQHVRQAESLGELAGLPQSRYRWHVAMAHLRLAEGETDAALALLDEAERLYERDFFPNTRPLDAVKARVWITAGRLAEADAWARQRGLSAHDPQTYLHEYEHITLARLLLARHHRGNDPTALAAALDLIVRLLAAADAGGRTGSVIELLLLQALALQAQHSPEALVPLKRAITLAQPAGYARVFVDEGEPLLLMLGRLANRAAPGYVEHLLHLMGARPQRAALPPQGLADPLSSRELEVLRLLATDMSGPEIARELVVSLNTLRTHTKNIFLKLGVNNRLAAIHRAEALDLL